ncbi:hypothetical protein CCP1ISM_160022 [Azospirillaceae bacterium]
MSRDLIIIIIFVMAIVIFIMLKYFKKYLVSFCEKPEIKPTTKVITDTYKKGIKIITEPRKEETEEFKMLDIYIDEEEIKLEAYYIAEKDGFIKPPEVYWEMAKIKLIENNETKPLM